MDNTDETFELIFGTEKMEQLEKAFAELEPLDKKYKNKFTEGDQLSFYYTINYTDKIYIKWQKGGPPDNIKQEIRSIMDKYFKGNRK